MSAVWCAAPWDWILQMRAVISYCAVVDVCCMVHSPMGLSTADAGCHQLLRNSWCLLYGAQPHGTEYCKVLAIISCWAVVGVCCIVRSPTGLSIVKCWLSSVTVQQLISAVWCAAPWDWVLQSAGCHQLLCNSWCALWCATLWVTLSVPQQPCSCEWVCRLYGQVLWLAWDLYVFLKKCPVNWSCIWVTGLQWLESAEFGYSILGSRQVLVWWVPVDQLQ